LALFLKAFPELHISTYIDMWRVFIILFSLLILSIQYLKAQQGCLIGTPTGGTLYIDNFLGFYETGGRQYLTSAPACPRVLLGTKAGTCVFSILGQSHDLYNYTLITTTSSPIACPIDECLLLLFGLYGAYRLKKEELWVESRETET